jgi:aminoglycoside 3-N-acetyltransferase
MSVDRQLPITPSQLKEGMKALGIHAGQIVMLHGSVNAIGEVMGGPNTILQALLDVLTPTGTLMMYAGWQDIPDFVEDLPEAERQVYYTEHPPFDPATARAVRDNSILAEFLRTWPGAQRSLNPEASIVAVGGKADWITRDHPMNYGYGAGSPLAKLVEANGQVLMLGAPLDTLTILHYAEFVAKLRHKDVIHYQCPILRDGVKVWIDVQDYNTGDHHDDYTFEGIADAYLASGYRRKGKIGGADSYLFDAAHLVRFAVDWLEARFGNK